MRWFVLGVVLIILAPAWLAADTVVCTDGRRFTGDVTRLKDGSYNVKTQFGEFNVAGSDVSQIIKSSAAPTSPEKATPEKSNPPTPPRGAEPDRTRILQERTAAAEHALAAAEFTTARSLFADLLQYDPNNPRILHGHALACAALDEMPRAGNLIDKALDYAGRAGHKPERNVVLNFCMIQLALDHPARAVRAAYDHLRSANDASDEQMLNALASALFQTDENFKRQPLFKDASQLYIELNARLERLHPGFKRWGDQWVTQAQFEHLDGEWKRTQANLNDLAARLDITRRKLADAEEAERISSPLYSIRKKLEANTIAAKADFDAAQSAYDAYKPGVIRPPFAATLTTVGLDDKPLPQDAQAFTLRYKATHKDELVQNDDTQPTPTPRPTPHTPTATPPTRTAPLRVPPRVLVQRRADIETATRYSSAFPIASDLVLAPATTVNGANHITLTSLTGDTYNCTVVSVDARLGAALLRVQGAALQPLPIAPKFSQGPVECITLASGLFDARIDRIHGSIKSSSEGSILTLQRPPRRMGAPLVSGQNVVGICLADSGTSGTAPMIGLDQLRTFCGEHLPAHSPTFLPPTPIYELTATIPITVP